MSKRFAIGLMIAACMTSITTPAFAQRGRPGGGGAPAARPATGGGGRPGGMGQPMGGMSRPAMPNGGGRPGGGMARPAPAQMARPSMPNRPGNMGMARPNNPMQNRPSGMTRPSMPNPGMANRPNIGGMNRPSMPGGVGGGGFGNMNRPGMQNRPGMGQPGIANRPSTMPGITNPGGMTRPGGGIASGLRPGGGATTLPGQIGQRPGGGIGGINRPGGGATTLPGQIGQRPGGGLGGMNRPGGGIGGINRPGQGNGGVTTLPGQIGQRPGGGLGGINRPGGGTGGINRPGGGTGGINRPGLGNGGATTLPGQIGNRPGGGIGNGNRPPWGNLPTDKLPPGMNRPIGGGGWGNGGTGNRPGGGNWGGNGGTGNRPGNGNWGNGWNNRPGNRPGGGNWGNWNNGNNSGNNIINNNNNNTIVNRPGWGGGNNWGGGNWGGGNWGGGNWNGNGNWGGGNWGGGGWGGGGGGWYGGGGNVVNNYYGPGWSGANYGNWYNGSNNFWGGFGTGLVTSWGLNALFNPGYAYSSYSYMPSAWAAPVYGSWGLNSIASDWMYSSYANPYITPATQTVYVQQPQPVVVNLDGTSQAPVTQQVAAYDYSQPINTTAPPPEPTAAESAQKVFESARDAFKKNDFGTALNLADQALSQLQSDPVLHEFRALCLFALKRYEEAAAVNYAVLSAGPSWDWATMINLYSSIDVYTNQLRDLESYVRTKPDSAPALFQLAFLYLAQGAKEAAAKKFDAVAKLQPSDTLSAQLAKTLDPSPERLQMQKTLTADNVPPQPTSTNATDAQPTPGSTEVAAPPPPPAKLVGTWTASPDPKVKITLVLKADGEFTWAVTQDGRTQTIQGQAGYKDDVLILTQQDGPPLTGKINFDDSKKDFSFKPPGSAESVPGLTFAPDTTHS